MRSYPSKLQEFKEFISETSNADFNFDIIGLQEIWHIPSKMNLSIPGYQKIVHKTRSSEKSRRNLGGGVAFYVRDGLEFEILETLSTFEEKTFESLFIKIKLSKNEFKIIGNLYRSPNGNGKRFNELLLNCLEQIEVQAGIKHTNELILLGDSNFNLLNYKNSTNTNEFLNTLLAHGLLPTITLPSRISNHTATLIDNISSNTKCTNTLSGLIYSCISDHLPVFHINIINSTRAPPEPKLVRNMCEKNILSFKETLRNYVWDDVLAEQNPETAFSMFSETMNTCFNNQFPLIKQNINRKSQPINKWMTAGLLTSRKRKHNLAKLRIKHPTVSNILNYKKFNNVYKSLIRKAKYNYYSQKFEDSVHNMKKTWGLINELIASKKDKSTIPNEFYCNGKTYVGSQQIAAGFNEFFVNVGPNLAKKVPESKIDFKTFMPNIPEEQENFVFANVSPELIYNTLARLKTKKSSGKDGISTHLLKQIITSIIDPVTYLFNLSFKTGFIPDDFKCAKVTPIYKSDEQSDFTNYRPISVLSSFSKLIEKIAAIQIFKYLNKYNILYEHQYGFRPKHDTTQPLIQFLDKIYKALNKDIPEYTIGIFLDLKKAFDTVCHSKLLFKMSHYGFKGISQVWFQNYLRNRTQYVQIDEIYSDKLTITCGVPQGSVLGPLLFLLYINDLPRATKFFTSLFADDTGFLLSATNILDLMNKANNELAKASVWFQANELTLNLSKTKYMIFRNKNMNIDQHNIQLKSDNVILERIGNDCKTKYYKFVGIRLDEFIAWDQHIDFVASKLSCACYALNQVKHILPLHIRKTVYNSLVRSHLEYGILAWGFATNKRMKKIVKMQKKAVRNVTKSSFTAHTDPMFGKQKILKFKDLAEFNAKTFMYKHFYSKLPKSFDSLFQPLAGQNRTKNYVLEKVKRKSLLFFPSVFLPQIWNNTHGALKNTENLKLFQSYLKDHTFFKYNSFRCDIQNCYACK